MSTMTSEREAFGRWFYASKYAQVALPGADDVQRAWDAWQARAHLAQPAQAVDVGAGSAHKDEDPAKLARAVCEAVIKHQFQDKSRHGRLTLDVQTFLRELNAARDSGLTRDLTGEKAGRVDGWQPIETAPKDGTAILVCTLGRQIDIATWDGKVWKDYAYGESCGASHWQPLPASPAPDKEG